MEDVAKEMEEVGIEIGEVERALKMLKNGKAAGTDDIIGESLKYGGDAVRRVIGVLGPPLPT